MHICVLCPTAPTVEHSVCTGDLYGCSILRTPVQGFPLPACNTPIQLLTHEAEMRLFFLWPKTFDIGRKHYVKTNP